MKQFTAGRHEERMRSVVDHVIDGIITIDARGTIGTFNPAAERIFGYLSAEVVGQNVKILMPESYRSHHDDYIEKYLRTGQKEIIGIGREVLGRRKDGRTFPMDLAVSEFRIEQRRYFTGIIRDITERRRAEERLRQSEGRLRLAFNSAAMGAWEFDIDAGENRWSEGMAGLLGVAVGDAADASKRWTDFIYPEDRERVKREFGAACKEGAGAWSGDFRVIRADGETRWLNSRGNVILSAGSHRMMLGVAQDITERKRAEESLRELTQTLTYHVDHSPLAVIEWGPDMRLTRWSGAAERVFGWSAEEVIGKRMEDFRWIYDEDQRQVADVSADLKTGRNARRFSLNRNYRKDGSVVWCEWHNSSLIDETGKLRSILSLVLDVTERKGAEEALARANEQLSEAHRRKDEFLAMLAHELRNPLGAVLSTCSVLRAVLDNPKAATLVDRVERQSRAVLTIVEDLLDLERVRVDRLTVAPLRTDLRRCVREAVERFEEAMASRPRPATLVQPDEPVEAVVDPARCVQIVANLVENAVKYAGAEAQITVTVAATAQNEAYIEVRDDGVGIEPTVAAALLDGRGSGGDAAKGLGIGLPLCDRLARLQGGRLDLRSGDTWGRGLAVVVTFPLAAPLAKSSIIKRDH